MVFAAWIFGSRLGGRTLGAALFALEIPMLFIAWCASLCLVAAAAALWAGEPALRWPARVAGIAACGATALTAFPLAIRVVGPWLAAFATRLGFVEACRVVGP
jgi:hypothetical protein